MRWTAAIVAAALVLVACSAAIAPQSAWPPAVEPCAKAVVEVWAVTGKDSANRGAGVHIGGGEFLTAAHLFSEPYLYVGVHYIDDSIALAQVVRQDVGHDVARIRVASVPPWLPTPRIDSRPLAVGERVFSIGHPFGLTWAFVQGYIMRRPAAGHALEVFSLGGPGISGGGVFREDGALVGISLAYVSMAESAASLIAMAAPIAVACQAVACPPPALDTLLPTPATQREPHQAPVLDQ